MVRSHFAILINILRKALWLACKPGRLLALLVTRRYGARRLFCTMD